MDIVFFLLVVVGAVLATWFWFTNRATLGWTVGLIGVAIILTVVIWWRGSLPIALSLVAVLSVLAAIIVILVDPEVLRRAPFPASERRRPAVQAAEDHRMQDALATRAHQAEVEGRIGTAIRFYAQTGNRWQVMNALTRLTDNLPGGPIRSALPAVADELLELQRNVEIARRTGVPAPVTDRLAREADVAATALWERVDRIAAVALMVKSHGQAPSGRPSYFGPATPSASDWNIFPALPEALGREAEKMNRLLGAIREARTGLAELTLSGGAERRELDQVEDQFRALAGIARAIQEDADFV